MISVPPVTRRDVADVCAELPQVTSGIGEDGLPQSPWMIGRGVDEFATMRQRDGLRRESKRDQPAPRAGSKVPG